MALTIDNILNLMALIIMCIPGLWSAFKFARRQWVRGREALLPVASPRRLPAHMGHSADPPTHSPVVKCSTPAQAYDNTFELRNMPSQYVSPR
ncbi:uncharacterized protein F4822DRAFT_389694 [Hypoxylon trugodes]|uniref:uncharacterized protein n=1 Tax=Hypoxylon trugodes TaxID=326681 RepID=UPI0021935BA5|nr:uncharacterized protein F4822DRAFT_389694 [Hypoxylon trugodes]KAI1392136.1 hypothetical protein F4822DRAFT_389694 [Hypoxylon trugodes]